MSIWWYDLARISVDVPDQMKQEIQETAEQQHYQSPSEYIRQALREKLDEDTELDPELLLRAIRLDRGEAETKDIEAVIEKYR